MTDGLSAMPGPLSGLVYFDRHGRRIGRQTWLALSARPEYVIVARDTVDVPGGERAVITMWLGIATRTVHPPIFQTIVDDPRTPLHGRPLRWTWQNLEQAVNGHHQTVSWLHSAHA